MNQPVLLSFLTLCSFLLSASDLCLARESATKAKVSFCGTVRRCEIYRHQFSKHLVFTLKPICHGGPCEADGFSINIYDTRRPDDELECTLPLRGVRTPDIMSWHFRNEDNSGPNTGSVNAPQKEREFYFSQRYGYNDLKQTNDVDHWLAKIKRDGQGVLTITKLDLGNLGRGKKPTINSMNFRVDITFTDH